MLAERTRRWLISGTISPAAWNVNVTGVLGTTKKRGDDAQMRTCGSCRIARFCSADHQKMAANSVASGGAGCWGRQKDLCSVLGKWRRQAVKDGMYVRTHRCISMLSERKRGSRLLEDGK